VDLQIVNDFSEKRSASDFSLKLYEKEGLGLLDSEVGSITPKRRYLYSGLCGMHTTEYTALKLHCLARGSRLERSASEAA
jgi:hypothetical protein